MVEQSTAAAASLKMEAEQLAELVGRFDTGTAVLQAAAQPRPLARERSRLRVFTGGASAATADQWEEF